MCLLFCVLILLFIKCQLPHPGATIPLVSDISSSVFQLRTKAYCEDNEEATIMNKILAPICLFNIKLRPLSAISLQKS